MSLVLAWPLGLLTTGFGLPDAPRLGVLPKHFLLHPGEEIHYTVVAYSESSKARMPDCTLSIENPEIVRSIEPKGVLEAVQRGRTELVIRTPNSERRVTVEVAGRAQPAMKAVPHRVSGRLLRSSCFSSAMPILMVSTTRPSPNAELIVWCEMPKSMAGP